MICPHCGNKVDQNAELCPYCNKPTQFSAKMKYYPREIPIKMNQSSPQMTNPEKPIVIPELKAILDKMNGLSRKEDLRPIKSSIITSAILAGILTLLCCLGIFIYTSVRFNANDAKMERLTASINQQIYDVKDICLKIQALEDERLSTEQIQSGTQIDEQSSKNINLVLHCDYPDEDRIPITLFIGEGTSIKLPALSYDTYTFSGWKSVNEDDAILLSPGTEFLCEGRELIELYACWEKEKIFSIEPSLHEIEEPTPSPLCTEEPDSEASPIQDAQIGKMDESKEQTLEEQETSSSENMDY